MMVCDVEHLTGLGSAWLEYSHSSDEYGLGTGEWPTGESYTLYF